jgi:hypothetical protein
LHLSQIELADSSNNMLALRRIGASADFQDG